ncbi:MAG: arginine--tRNA ligase [Candidatus Euphemobacter frigidus]|nr:arginine--tRNA ligase [Candidatus Euphemobacter frigidus]MDP8275061.1 arginine--tRNA ligase [Candidatus Euphemobacter frigidus]
MLPEINDRISELIGNAFREAAAQNLLPPVSLPSVELKIPREKGHGDLASNIAMKVASRVKRSPVETAKIIASLIEKRISRKTIISRVEADPRKGFLNFTVTPGAFHDALRHLLRVPGHWGESRAGEGEKVLLEFVSANPTGPLTVAHGRQAAVGDVLANLLAKAGYRVSREYYLNDRGRQMKILGESVYLRWRELRGEEVDLPADYYQGDYIIGLARRILEGGLKPAGRELSELPPEEAIDYCGTFASGALLEMIKKELRDFGVEMETWVSESELVAEGRVTAVLRDLAARGSTYEKDGALWFRSSAYGDEKDRVLRKKNGDLTYISSDIAYHREKYGRGYSEMIDFWGPDHHGYIARLKGAMKALGLNPARLDIIIVQLSTLYEGKKKLSMSTRMGEFISLRQVLDKVGKDAARYFFVRRRKESHLDFDLELARKKTNDNPVYYVQYAHARINSIFKKFRAVTGRPLPDFTKIDLACLSEPAELELIKKLVLFPGVVKTAALTHQNHLIPAYLEELAAIFHSYYNHCRVITDDPDLTAARLALARATQLVISEGLSILGVSAPDSM